LRFIRRGERLRSISPVASRLNCFIVCCVCYYNVKQYSLILMGSVVVGHTQMSPSVFYGSWHNCDHKAFVITRCAGNNTSLPSNDNYPNNWVILISRFLDSNERMKHKFLSLQSVKLEARQS
jgi:hypothetical protein